MTEPTYIFVKGRGWVIGPELACPDKLGKLILLNEVNLPKIGDRWLCCNIKSNGLLNADGTFNVPKIYTHVASFDFEQWSICNTDTYSLIKNNFPPQIKPRFLILTLA